MARLNLLAWNCWVANRDDNVIAALWTWALRYDPDVIALSEAASHADALHEWAERHGYTLLQAPVPRRRKAGRVVDDTGDCAILLGPHVTIRHEWVASMRQMWMVFSHRRWHTPHRYQVAHIVVRGQRWRVRASHWPTLGMHGPNKAAWLESAHASRRWLDRSTFPSVDVGDLNEQAPTLAEWFGKRFQVFGKGIDVAVARGVREGTWTELGKGGGDHHGRFYRLTA